MFAILGQALNEQDYAKFDVFSFHPVQLASYLEVLWEVRRRLPPPALPADLEPPMLPDAGLGKQSENVVDLAIGAKRRYDVPVSELMNVLDRGIPSLSARLSKSNDLYEVFPGMVQSVVDNALLADGAGAYWHHLIYAYLIENTRAFDVFERVLFEAVHGEKLGVLDEASHRWVRATEELFFRQNPPFMLSLASSIRPDGRATRRNAYQRMFGMELNHGKDAGPYPFERAEASNQDFVTTFEQFLREVWRGYVNATNTSGPNTTDDSAIAFLATRLSQMLRDRRENGHLTREEFVAVATLSWFDFTLSDDSPIVIALKAESSSPEERLRKIAERVGMKSHTKARSLFELSYRVSALLIQLERGAYNDVRNVPVLYTPSRAYNAANPIAGDMVEIIIHWSLATGRDLKSVPVNGLSSAAAAQ